MPPKKTTKKKDKKKATKPKTTRKRSRPPAEPPQSRDETCSLASDENWPCQYADKHGCLSGCPHHEACNMVPEPAHLPQDDRIKICTNCRTQLLAIPVPGMMGVDLMCNNEQCYRFGLKTLAMRVVSRKEVEAALKAKGLLPPKPDGLPEGDLNQGATPVKEPKDPPGGDGDAGN